MLNNQRAFNGRIKLVQQISTTHIRSTVNRVCCQNLTPLLELSSGSFGRFAYVCTGVSSSSCQLARRLKNVATRLRAAFMICGSWKTAAIASIHISQNTPRTTTYYNNWNCVEFCQPSCLQVYICFTTCVFQLQLFSKCSAPFRSSLWPMAFSSSCALRAHCSLRSDNAGTWQGWARPGMASCHKSVWKWGTRYTKYLEIS